MLTGAAIPEPGQLVRLRGEYWVVTDVQPSTLPPDVLSTRPVDRASVVALSNVGDDRLGEELSVVWEREPGAAILESATLPDVRPGSFDPPARMAAFLDAIRWGSVASADAASMQSPFRAGIRIEDYQLDPVVRALRSPRANLLIADDVGLGKTIEAGLIIQELILRQRARRIIIVVPADLTLKWQREMAEKFGLEFQIVDSAAIRQLRRKHGPHANPWRIWPRTIVSLPWLRGERGTRAMDDFLPAEPGLPRAFDLLVVDEAAHLAPAGSGVYAVDTLQTRAVARLTPHTENRLFLTASPHNGYRNSFAALLELLDPQRFARGAEPDRAALSEVMIRRTKDDDIFINEDGTRRFPERHPVAVPVRYSDVERQAHDLLERYADARCSQPGKTVGKAHKKANDLTTLLLKKRLFSSPAAFTTTLRVHAQTVEGTRVGDFAVTDEVPSWLVTAEEAVEDDYLLEEDKDAAEEELLARAARIHGMPAQARELLGQLLVWAENHGQAPDAKATVLIDWLRGTLIDPETGEWRDDRVVIFTEYRATQRWLKDLLDAAGLGGERLSLLFGGQDSKQREHIKDAFQAAPARDPVRILLATDSASEGIDLQKHAWRVINYDIPFNPNRLDQRIGRVDRYGQTHDVEIIHFIGEGWEDSAPGSYERDLEFLSRVATKIATIKEDLGKVNRLISQAVQAHMTGDGAASDILDTVTPTPARDLLKFELQTREWVAEAAAELAASVENLRVGPANIERVVATALDLAGQPPLAPGPEPGTWIVGKRHGVWERATRNLPDPLDPAIIRPITFDPDVAAALDDQVVLAHLGHPLVADSTRLLRARVWGTGNSDLRRVTIVTVPPDVTAGRVAVAAYSRLVIVGGDGDRLHEEVFAAGGTLDSQNRWERLTVGRLEVILNEALDATDTVVDAHDADRVADDWERIKGLLGTATETRAKERYESVARKLGEKRDADIERHRERLLHLKQQIEQALKGPKPEQMDLFEQMADDEKDQYRADRASWEARLEQIPGEITADTERIAARYADLTRLVFPAAVVIALPAVSESVGAA